MNTWKNLEVHHGSQKSFYGKAKVCWIMGRAFLKSYDTTVAMVTEDGHFIKMWDGYSPTTARHINSFRVMMGLQPIRKAEWDSMEVGAKV